MNNMGNKQNSTKEAQFINPNSAHFKDFKIQDHKIQYLGENGKPTQIVGNYVGPVIQITFTIINCQKKFMSCGIIDQRYTPVDRSSTHRPNSVSYTSGGGFIQSNIRKGWAGPGFKTGDVVKMIAEKQSGYFECVINGESYNHISQCLLNQKADWVPFFQFYNTGDIIVWK